MVINNKYIQNPRIVTGSDRYPVSRDKLATQNKTDFAQILKEQQIRKNKEVIFSKHAEQRLKSRNIRLTDTEKIKLGDAVSKAEAKGVRDSLVLMDNVAFVVNVGKRTVITAVDSQELKENVFTNIDGAVIV